MLNFKFTAFIFCCLSIVAVAAELKRPKLLAPIYLREEKIGETWTYPNPNEDLVELDAVLFSNSISNYLNPEVNSRLHALTGSLVDFAALKKIGIYCHFDEVKLEITIQLEGALQAKRDFRIRPEREELPDLLAPSPFSGYINIRANQTYQYPKADARNPFNANLGYVNNFQGTVLESGATYLEKSTYAWKRDDTRITRDFESSLLRGSAGDLSLLTTSFQNARSIGGLGFSRQFSIQPYATTRSLNRTELFLQHPSTIEIYVNNSYVNRIQVPGGPIQLSDFPLFSGMNKVDLKITDTVGKVEWINLNLLYDVQLLGEGVQQFAYQSGAPSTSFRQDRRYDTNNITNSLFHRIGLTDKLTIGANFQNDNNMWLSGEEFAFLTKAGLFSGEYALSHIPGISSSAFRANYKSLDFRYGEDRTIRGALGTEYRGRRFATLGSLNSLNEYSWKHNASLSKSLSNITNLSLGLQYESNRLGGSDNRSLRTDLSSQLFKEWRSSISYTISKTNHFDHQVSILLTWVEKTGRYFGNLAYDYPAKSARADITRNPESAVGDYRLSAGVQTDPGSNQGNLSLEYAGERGTIRADHSTTRINEINGYRHSVNYSGITLGSAIVFASGKFALSRPVSDSFLLLGSKKFLSNIKIPVNAVNGAAETTVNSLGPGVIPTLTAYNETPIYLNSSELPPGVSLGKEYYRVRPTYRSGSYVEIGGEGIVMVVGQLITPEGKGLNLAVGEVNNVRTPSNKVSFFTNQNGQFVLENMAAGEIILHLDSDIYRDEIVKISEDQIGILRIPPIQLKLKDQK